MARSGQSRRQELLTSLVVVVVATFNAVLVYNRHFHGLASYRTPDGMESVDGAYHIANYMEFARTSSVYQGCVTLYSFWDAARRLGSTHLIIAVNAGFALGRVVTAIAPLVVGLTVLHKFRNQRAAYWSGVTVCAGAALSLQYSLVLPIETVQGMGGFWPHLFGVVPLMTLWMVDALVRRPALRVLGIAIGVAVYRYTYALNLGDLIAAVGGLLVLEALGRARWPLAVRALFVVAAVGGAFVSYHCYTLIRTEFLLWGWIVHHDVMAAWAGQLLAIGALLAPLLAPPAREAVAGSGLYRALRLPIFFGLANALYVWLVWRIPLKAEYYFQKWDFHSVVLLASALVVLAAFATAALIRAREDGGGDRARRVVGPR